MQFVQPEVASRLGVIQALAARKYMTRPTLLLLVCLLPACATDMKGADFGASERQCISAHERGAMLSLDEERFDQDFSDGGGGWRAIAARAGCEHVAAEVIRDYRERHLSRGITLYWHEGQMRASGGDYPAAIRLFEKSRKPEDQNFGGWNHYVDASIAFLRRDKPALVQARDALSKTKAPPGFGLKDGVFEIPNKSGAPFKMRWPPNIDVVDGLINCFEKTYREAYDDAKCRPSPPE